MSLTPEQMDVIHRFLRQALQRGGEPVFHQVRVVCVRSDEKGNETVKYQKTIFSSSESDALLKATNIVDMFKDVLED
jgi:hypothetical protein